MRKLRDHVSRVKEWTIQSSVLQKCDSAFPQPVSKRRKLGSVAPASRIGSVNCQTKRFQYSLGYAIYDKDHRKLRSWPDATEKPIR